MDRTRRGIGAVAIVAVVLALGVGSATAAGSKKLVEGTLYDTTCATACTPECPPPPHCGPITQAASTAVVCAQPQRIVCPLAGRAAAAPDFCIQGEPCGVNYPVYAGEGAVINVRKRGSSAVLATLPVAEGHFRIRLGPGTYVFHPYLPEAECWSGEPATLKVTAKLQSPVPATLDVANHCVAHPDAG